MLENFYHAKSCFVTLTYRDSDLPYNLCSGLPVLEKRDCQLWIKRLRKQLSGTEIRYYLAGEYGSRSHRPHYHVILFGIGPEQLDPDYLVYGGKSGGATGIEKRSTLLSMTWPFGLVHVGEVTRESIQYVAGYVTKKITKKGDGYVPEFALMSRRPGIGSRAVAEIAAVLQQYDCEEKAERSLRIGGQKWPLGRYLQGKLSELLGVTFDIGTYVQQLRKCWVQANRSGVPFLDFIVEQDAGRYAKLEARNRIYNDRGEI